MPQMVWVDVPNGRVLLRLTWVPGAATSSGNWIWQIASQILHSTG